MTKTPEKLRCPCCGKLRDIAQGTPLIKIQKAYRDSWLCASDDWAVQEAQGCGMRAMRWACNYCLKTGKAIAARPEQQTYCDYPPYLAYFDWTCRCLDCQNDFVFSAREQQYWYEERKFWVQSRPIRCLACRRKARERRRVPQLLQQALTEFDLHDPRQLLQIVLFYLMLESPRKASEFLGRARRWARERGELEEFADQFAVFAEQIQALRDK